jgi:hypothetical protein
MSRAKTEEIEPLDKLIERAQAKHVARDVFVTEIAHPHASDRIYPGKYSGIRLKKGPVSVTYSDGSKE